MNNLTNAEIRKIYGMYLGADLYAIPDYINYRKEYGLHGHDIRVKLKLTPLSKITDEHAIEIAKIFVPEVEKWVIYRKGEWGTEVTSYSNKFMVFLDFKKSTISVFVNNREAWVDCQADNIINAIDKLRELGYALPYKGQSLFELGIAIDKTTIK